MITFLFLLLLEVFNPVFVKVGDRHNVAVDKSGLGRVDYDYEIMAYEVTNREYCLFLNSVAKDSDIHNLYSPIMSESFMGGIERDKKNGKWHYHVKKGFENKPVTGVSWNSAARYVNWLNYNSDKIESGADISTFRSFYESRGKQGCYDIINSSHRNSSACYWLPDRNEWLKALYFNGHAWKTSFPMQKFNIYSYKSGWAYPFPHIRDIGISGAKSHYGTYDQIGNLAEWIEDGNGEFKYTLGGSLIRTKEYSDFNVTEGDFPDKNIPSFGFRVCRTTDIGKRKAIPSLPATNLKYSLRKTPKTSVQRDSNGGTYVLIDKRDNEGDKVNGLKGSVKYDYYISKYELTNAEYCRFLNHIATVEDKYDLYDPNMSTGVTGGIIKRNVNGKTQYYVKPGWEKKPVTYIGFYELARYANWLHYGCPRGEQRVGTTEGTADKGAYDTSQFEIIRNGKSKPHASFGRRNKGALFWIPNEDEWYKAAYYDPEKIGNRKYHDYPTRTSDKPDKTKANYMYDMEYAIGSPFYLADVDEYPNGESYFGTQQQGGNVWEWTESWQYGNVGVRALRGGSWQYTEYGLNAVNEDPGGIDNKSYLYGGRLCKAADKQGYDAADKDFTDSIYKYIYTLPRRHMLIMLSAFTGIAFILIVLIILLSIKCLKLRRKI